MTRTQARKPTDAPVPSGVLRRKCACGGKCSSCKADEDGELRRKATGREPGEVPAVVYDVLREPGAPLDAGTRAFFEPRFGADFSDVRVHTGGRAAESAEAVSAAAYTVGRDVVFGPGGYNPGSTAGRELLAHELAHTRQQQGGAGTTGLTIGGVATTHERDADSVAATVLTEAPAPAPALTAGAARQVMRTPLFTSTVEVCKRVLKSRVFRVNQGGIVVTIGAGWEPSEQWAGAEPPRCGREQFSVTLSRAGMLFDDEFGTCQFPHGSPVTKAWGELPEGDYYLTVWTNNTNPNCCLRGSIEVAQQRGLPAGTCTVQPPGPLEMLHTALDLAGLVPALGAIPDAINAGIYVVEGDWVNAGFSAVALIPLFGDAASVVRTGGKLSLRVRGEAVERVGSRRIADAIGEARAAERRAASEAAEGSAAARAGERRGAAGAGRRIAGLARCRIGSLYCPIDFLREEFSTLFRQRAGFARYAGEVPQVDLNLAQSLRRDQTILTGEGMYAQFLREVPRGQWSDPFRDAVDRARRAGIDHREILIDGRRHPWPLDGAGNPWVVHHEPPLMWVPAESNQWWKPMPYAVHDAAHGWWRRLERQVKERIPADMRREILEGDFDIREFP